MNALSCGGAFIYMGGYNHNVAAVTKMGAYIHWGVHFVWVLIILILQYVMK